MKNTILAALATAVVAMTGFWLVSGREYISRSEAAIMIETQSPYIKDQSLILSRLKELVEVNKELQKTVADLKTEVAELKVILKVNNEFRETHNLLPEKEVW